MNELINALLSAQEEITHATKDGKNPFFGSGYATLEQVITTVKAPLLKHGILFQQKSHLNELGACVETVFYGHGGCLETGPLLIIADKRDPHGFGSALTYAKRYSLSLACGIGHQADDDANAATTSVKDAGQAHFENNMNSGRNTYLDNLPDGEKPRDKFKLMNGHTTVAAYSTPNEFLAGCREFLSKPDTAACKKIYADSKADIKVALHLTKDTKTAEGLKKLISLYENSDD